MTIRKLFQFKFNAQSLVLLVALLALAVACPQTARAGGVVTVCNEAGLKAALFGGGTVTFGCSGTISVLGGTITISTNTTIDGRGRNITISGGGKVQLFIVNAERTLHLKQITVADGFISDGNGGGVLNNGTLNVINCTFRGNAATTRQMDTGGNGGGIYNNDYLTVINSTFENNTASFSGGFNPAGLGGGIFNNNDATITNSTFHGNSAISGGGIFTGSQGDSGLLVVDNSTFNNNQITGSANDGPGLGAGGGIYNQAFITVVTNSTFYANGGTGAIGGNIYVCCNGSGTALLDNDTIAGGIAAAGNGGNISTVTIEQGQAGTLFVENTIVANAASGMNCDGSFTDLGGNLRWPTSDSTCLGSYGDPKLEALANYGGPTSTLALEKGSAAINTAIEKFCPSTDQRGVLRPQGPQCDIGAFEYSTSRLLGVGVVVQLNAFVDSLLSPLALDKLRGNVIVPLRLSVDANLWTAGDGNHVTGSEVFTLQRAAVDSLSQLIVDPKQLAYINNLVMADRNLAATAINDQGCSANPNPSASVPPQGPCALATTELAEGDASAAIGEYSEAISHYLNAWRLTTP